MPLLPYRKLKLRSCLPAAQVAEVLANSVEPRRWLRLGSGRCPFEGTVKGFEFDVQRIISYRNSFLPQIRGTITSEPYGSCITITMRLHIAVLIFMSVWFGGVLLGGVAIARAAFVRSAGVGSAA